MLHRGAEKSRFRAALALILCLMLLWGFGHRLFGALGAQFVSVFSLTGWRGVVTARLYDFAYLFLPLPAVMYARQFGYKASLLLSLGCLTIGTFTLYPAAEMHAFGYYIAAISFIVTGWIALENTLNPLIVVMGPQETAVQRLLAFHCLYPIGAMAGVAAGYWVRSTGLFQPHAGDAVAIGHPYIVVGTVVLLLAFAVEEIRFPSIASERVFTLKGLGGTLKPLLGGARMQFALVAQFACILASANVWQLSGLSLQRLALAPPEPFLNDTFFVCAALFFVGRVAGTAAMMRLRPETVLAAAMIFAGLAAVAAIFASGVFRAGLILALNLPLAIAWPALTGLSLRGLGPAVKLATGLLNTAGAMGGVAFAVMAAPSLQCPDWLILAATSLCCLAMSRFAAMPHRLASCPMAP